MARKMDQPFSYNEDIIIRPKSEKIIELEVRGTSQLTCRDSKACQSIVSPFPSGFVSLLLDHQIRGLSWQISSQTSSVQSQITDSEKTSPAGLYVEVQSHKEGDSFGQVLQTLLDNRMLLAPLDSVDQDRFHRHILARNSTKQWLSLPTDSSAVTSEGIKAFLQFQPCAGAGLLGSVNATKWSETLQGMSGTSLAHTKRDLAMEIKASDGCYLSFVAGDCQITLRHSIRYGKRLSASKPFTLDKLLPTRSIHHCAFTRSSKVQTILPEPVQATFAILPESTAQNGGFITTYQHDFTMDTLKGYWMTINNSFRDQIYWKLNKKLYRPNGVSNGGILETRISNLDSDCSAQVILNDVLPDFLMPRSIHFSLPNHTRTTEALGSRTLVLHHNFILPPKTDAILTIVYDPVLLPFELFPADPNRGIELEPSWANIESSCARTTTLYSEALLLMPPVPDMSMPFNVMSLTCTLFAFVLGSVINQLIRRGTEKIFYKMHPEKKPKNKLQILKEKVLDRLRRKGNQGERNEVPKETKTVELRLEKGTVRDGRVQDRIPGKAEDGQPTTQGSKESAIAIEAWIPEANVVEEGADTPPMLLSHTQRQSLAATGLPGTVSNRPWRRVYSLVRDGDAFETFLRNVHNEECTLLVVKTTKSSVFGSYTESRWGARQGIYGSGRAFLYRMIGEEAKIYNWTGVSRQIHHVNIKKERLAVGGGGAGDSSPGLCVEDAFQHGTTSRCQTFNNDPLCDEDDGVFKIADMECYGFVKAAF